MKNTARCPGCGEEKLIDSIRCCAAGSVASVPRSGRSMGTIRRSAGGTGQLLKRAALGAAEARTHWGLWGTNRTKGGPVDGGTVERFAERVLTLPCAHCGDAFTAHRRHQRFCRSSCRIAQFKQTRRQSPAMSDDDALCRWPRMQRAPDGDAQPLSPFE